MKIKVTVKTGAKAAGIVSGEGNTYAVSVKSRAKQGKANREVVGLLAEHFGIAPSRIRIVAGLRAKIKLVEID